MTADVDEDDMEDLNANDFFLKQIMASETLRENNKGPPTPAILGTEIALFVGKHVTTNLRSIP